MPAITAKRAPDPFRQRGYTHALVKTLFVFVLSLGLVSIAFPIEVIYGTSEQIVYRGSDGGILIRQVWEFTIRKDKCNSEIAYTCTVDEHNNASGEQIKFGNPARRTSIITFYNGRFYETRTALIQNRDRIKAERGRTILGEEMYPYGVGNMNLYAIWYAALSDCFFSEEKGEEGVTMLPPPFLLSDKNRYSQPYLLKSEFKMNPEGSGLPDQIKFYMEDTIGNEKNVEFLAAEFTTDRSASNSTRYPDKARMLHFSNSTRKLESEIIVSFDYNAKMRPGDSKPITLPEVHPNGSIVEPLAGYSEENPAGVAFFAEDNWPTLQEILQASQQRAFKLQMRKNNPGRPITGVDWIDFWIKRPRQ